MTRQALNYAVAIFVIACGVAMVSRLRHLSLSHQPSTSSLLMLTQEVVSDLGLRPTTKPGVVEKAFYVSIIQYVYSATVPPERLEHATARLHESGFTMRPILGSKSRVLCKDEIAVEIQLSSVSENATFSKVAVTWGNGAIECET